MTRHLALIVDGMREARARYILPVFVVISVLATLIVLGLGYRAPDDQSLVEGMLGSAAGGEVPRYQDWNFVEEAETDADDRLRFVVGDPRLSSHTSRFHAPPDAPTGVDFDVQPRVVRVGDEVTVSLEIVRDEAPELVLEVGDATHPYPLEARDQRLHAGEVTVEVEGEPGEPVPVRIDLGEGEEATYRLPVAGGPVRWLRERLEGQGLQDVEVRRVEREEGSLIEAAGTIEDRTAVGGRTLVTIAFTSIEIPSQTSLRETVTNIQYTLVEWLFATGAVLLALVLTAGMVPNMLERGRIDVYLARPISRPAFLVGKYLGSCVFVLLNCFILVGGCFLVISVRSGVWNWSFLGTAFTTTLLFAVLYPVSVLIGVVSRSAILSALGSVFLWLLCWGIGFARFSRDIVVPRFGGEAGASAVWDVVDAVYWVLPKTRDMQYVNQDLVYGGQLTPATREQMDLVTPDISNLAILGTSGAFAAAVLAVAVAFFWWKDL